MAWSINRLSLIETEKKSAAIYVWEWKIKFSYVESEVSWEMWRWQLIVALNTERSEKWSVSCSVMSKSLQVHGLQPIRLLCPSDSPGKNTVMGCHSLLQGIFPTLGVNPGLLHCRQTLYHLSHQNNILKFKILGLSV